MAKEETNEGATNKVEPEVAEVEDIEALKQAVAEAKAAAESNLANWQRAQADFINYKRRSEQELEEISKFANATLMLSLLPILDDLERPVGLLAAQQAVVNEDTGKLVADGLVD